MSRDGRLWPHAELSDRVEGLRSYRTGGVRIAEADGSSTLSTGRTVRTWRDALTSGRASTRRTLAADSTRRDDDGSVTSVEG